MKDSSLKKFSLKEIYNNALIVSRLRSPIGQLAFPGFLNIRSIRTVYFQYLAFRLVNMNEKLSHGFP